MKRIIAILAIVAIALTASYAQDEEDQPPFIVTVGPTLNASLSGVFVGGSAQFAWKPGFFGLGAGLRGDINLGVSDVYLTPSAGVRIGWVCLDGGVVLKIVDAAAPTDYLEVASDYASPFIRAGAAIPIGPLSLDLGARFMFSDTYSTSSEGDDTAVEEAVQTGFQALLTSIIAVFGALKIDLGLSYRLTF